jgi:hypothetical protein
MSLDLKRHLVAQLVESSRLLSNHIDQRAKGGGTGDRRLVDDLDSLRGSIASDVLQDNGVDSHQ